MEDTRYEQLGLIPGMEVVGTRLVVTGLGAIIPVLEGKPFIPGRYDELDIMVRVKVGFSGAGPRKFDKERAMFKDAPEGIQTAHVYEAKVVDHRPAEPFNPFGERDERESA